MYGMRIHFLSVKLNLLKLEFYSTKLSALCSSTVLHRETVFHRTANFIYKLTVLTCHSTRTYWRRNKIFCLHRTILQQEV